MTQGLRIGSGSRICAIPWYIDTPEPIAKLKQVGDVRQRGLMIGIELVKDRKTKEEFSYPDRMGHKVALAARRREVMLRPLGNVVVLMPPLSIKPSEVDFLVDGVRESIREATE